MAQKDSASKVNEKLALYRERGFVDHKRTLAIPFNERIPELIKKENGREQVSMALAASILGAFQHIEKVKMDASQIKGLAECIIDTAHEDQLSIEDVLLFLKDLLMGKFGKITQTLDTPAFFEYFEVYRTKRYQTLENIRYEVHLNQKNMGSGSRSSVVKWDLKRGEDAATMLDLFETLNEPDGKE